jgi:hypothetical protein
MIQLNRPDITALMADGQQIDESLRLAFARTVLLHRRLGLPMMVWREGRVAEVSADLLPLDPADEAAARG